MKKLFYFLFLALVLFYLFWQRDLLVSRVDYLLSGPCDEPIAYRVGVVDGEYKVSRSDLLLKIRRAEGIWERAIGEDLFTYDPEAELAVNMVYTQRQAVLDKLEHLEGDLSSGESSLKVMVTEYEALVKVFRAKMEKFNQEVALWNDRGGAPSGVYEDLIRQQDALKAEANRLNAMAQKLNLSVEDYNLQVGEFNKNVEAYNEATVRRPEAGLYDGSMPKIDIYLTVSEGELIHTLAHELGHALGLGHFEDPEAIMYPFSTEVVRVSRVEVEALKVICEERNWEKYWSRARRGF